MSNYKENLNNLMSLDIFLMGLSPIDSQKMREICLPNQVKKPVLLSFDVFACILANFKRQISDGHLLTEFAQRFNWQADIQQIISNTFEALVLTDVQRQIIWVNEGFEAMTGYTSYEAIGKKPSFLQGKQTEKSTRTRFRERLAENKEFEITITNHRKSGESYQCKVQIFPLHNHQNQVTHFLALEEEIK